MAAGMNDPGKTSVVAMGFHSMNPVMTARFMRQGRIPHASPVADNLYLAGSSTHPGQWVSFCAISGILAADAVR